MMPPRGAEGRARATATLRVISHQRLVDPVLGELLDEAAADSLDAPRAAMVRVLRRERDQSVRLPDDVRAPARAGVVAWPGGLAGRPAATATGRRSGRASSEMVELKREQADLLGHDGERYDALLDRYEPGMRTERVERVFAALARRAQRADRRDRRRRPAAADPPFAGAEVPRRAPVGPDDPDAGRHRIRLRRRPPGPPRASVHDHDRAPRHPADDPDRRDRPLLRRSPRPCTRRATGSTTRVRPRLRGHADRPGAVAGPARVAVAPVGEPGRAQPAVLGAATRRCCTSVFGGDDGRARRSRTSTAR